MPENQQEQSEAKLLAYIEGELDAAERAEIEKHLEANPHHRMMLQQLSRTRDMVRWLPREPAPGDLLDTFQSQLERSALLEDRSPVADYAAAGKISPFTQWRAIAAAVLLAVGLGVIVWLVLPTGKQFVQAPALSPPASPEVNESSSTTAKPAGDAPAAAPDSEARSAKGGAGELLPDGVREKGEATTPSAGPLVISNKAGPADPAAILNGPGLVNSVIGVATPESEVGLVLAQTARTAEQLAVVRDNITGNSVGNSSGFAAARNMNTKVAPAAPTPDTGNALYVVVAASDPDAVSRQITGYLASNSIRWDNLDALSHSGASRFGSGGAIVSNAGPSILAQAAPPAAQNVPAPAPAPPAQTAAPAPVQPVPVPQPTVVASVPAPVAAPEPVSPQIPQTNPSEHKDLAEQQVATGNAAAGSINNLIIARRMTRGQAMELRGNFNRPTDSQYAEVFEPTPNPSADKQIEQGAQQAVRPSSPQAVRQDSPQAIPQDAQQAARPGSQQALQQNSQQAFNQSASQADRADSQAARSQQGPDQRPAAYAARASKVASRSSGSGLDSGKATVAPSAPPTTAPATQPAQPPTLQKIDARREAVMRNASTRPTSPLAQFTAPLPTSQPGSLQPQRAVATTSPADPVQQVAGAAQGQTVASQQQSPSTQPAVGGVDQAADEPVDVVIVVQKTEVAETTPPAAGAIVPNGAVPNAAATEPSAPSPAAVPVPAPQQAK